MVIPLETVRHLLPARSCLFHDFVGVKFDLAARSCLARHVNV